LPFSIGKGSRAALEGAAREQGGAAREQGGAAREQGRAAREQGGAAREYYGVVQGRSRWEPELAALSRLQLPTLFLNK